MPKLTSWAVLVIALTACTPQIGKGGTPEAALRTQASQATALTEVTEGVVPMATVPSPTLTPTFTPTPTPPPGSPLPTFPPPPTETSTVTPVPTVIPPTSDTVRGPLPGGWFAFSLSVHLVPDDPSPSLYACHLIVRRIDGSSERNLTPDSTDCATAPAISPDGQQVAYISGYVRNLSAGLGGDLRVARIDGSGITRLKTHVSSPTWIVWSKDNTQIANFFYGDSKWHVYDAVEGGSEVAALDALTPDSWVLPNLSPDGKYRASYCEADLSAGVRRLCITALADDPRPLGSTQLDGGITWTPDGEWIVYGAQDGTYATRPDGSDTLRVSEHGGAWWFDK
jgi:WD40 repeat protein